MEFVKSLDAKGAVVIVVVLAILSVPAIPNYVEETTYTYEPYNYKLTSDVRFINTTRLWFWHVTEAHQSIQNTDVYNLNFSLNFVFDNGLEKKTTTESVELLAGEEKEVVTDVDLPGNLTAKVNVLSPFKAIPHKQMVNKPINAWQMLMPFLPRW